MPGTGSILIVDNEPAIVDLLVNLLTDEGYVVYTAPDGASVLAAVARHSPALILLDMGRLGLRGAALIAQVRRAGPAILPIVLMTTTPREARPLLVLGSIECLDKPFDIDDVLVRVARYVQPTQTLASSIQL